MNDFADQLERARFEIEWLVARLHVAIEREEVPRRARRGEVAHRAQIGAIDLHAFEKLRPKFEHQQLHA